MIHTFKTIFLVTLLIPFCCFAQSKQAVIKVNMKTQLPEVSKVYLLENDGNNEFKIIDSAHIDNGQFLLKATVQEPKRVRMILDTSGIRQFSPATDKNHLDFFLENRPIYIYSSDLLSKAKVKAGEINKTYQKYNSLVLNEIVKKTLPIKQKYELLAKEERLSGDYLDSLRLDMDNLTYLEDSLNTKFIQKFPKSFVSLFVIQTNVGNASKNYINKKLFNYLDPTLKNSSAGEKIKARLYNEGLYNIGSVAPDFQQNDVNGILVKLSDFKGKYVLIDFWASWCGPCRKENPNVVKAFNTYKDRNFTVLGVSLDNPGKKEDWLKAISTDSLPWTNVSDLKGWDNSVAKLYGVRAIPHNVLVDPQGIIIAINLKGNNLQDFLKGIFQR